MSWALEYWIRQRGEQAERLKKWLRRNPGLGLLPGDYPPRNPFAGPPPIARLCPVGTIYHVEPRIRPEENN